MMVWYSSFHQKLSGEVGFYIPPSPMRRLREQAVCIHGLLPFVPEEKLATLRCIALGKYPVCRWIEFLYRSYGTATNLVPLQGCRRMLQARQSPSLDEVVPRAYNIPPPPPAPTGGR